MKVVALFSFAAMGVAGVGLVIRTFGHGQLSPAMELPMGYVYLAVPISGFFLTLYSVEWLVKTVQGKVVFASDADETGVD